METQYVFFDSIYKNYLAGIEETQHTAANMNTRLVC